MEFFDVENYKFLRYTKVHSFTQSLGVTYVQWKSCNY